ncbi:cytochrome P450 [Arthrobacter bambusae]|uniref:Cytochrome P450 n=1 Tax=Arthrobacter bambusae TaxID=1338426 RepID=A0ABV2P0T6_9MICC
MFDEAVRWLSPIGPYPRERARETALEGVRIIGGAEIGVVVASANHDNAHFGGATEEFEFGRLRHPHLGRRQWRSPWVLAIGRWPDAVALA